MDSGAQLLRNAKAALQSYHSDNETAMNFVRAAIREIDIALDDIADKEKRKARAEKRRVKP